MNSNSGSISFEIRGRQKAVHGQATDIEVDLFDLPSLLDLALVVVGLAVAVEHGTGVSGVGDVDAVHVFVVLDDRHYRRLPEDAVAVAVTLGAGHAHQLGVLELDDQPRSLAEVPPYRVPCDLKLRRALRPQHARGRL